MVPMGTAGSVRLLLDELTETFVVGSGDSVTSLNLVNLFELIERVAKVTMALWKVDDPTEFGIEALVKLKVEKLMETYPKDLS